MNAHSFETIRNPQCITMFLPLSSAGLMFFADILHVAPALILRLMSSVNSDVYVQDAFNEWPWYRNAYWSSRAIINESLPHP